MKDKTLDLNTSPDLPQSSASYEGGTGGSLAGANRQALKRGFIDGGADTGTEQTYDHNPGVAGRPHGWER